MTRDQFFGYAANATLILLVIVGAYYAITRPEPLPARSSTAPRTELTVYRAGAWDAPIVRYDAKSETLTITEHAPRSLLLCLRGTCDLIEGWRVKR